MPSRCFTAAVAVIGLMLAPLAATAATVTSDYDAGTPIVSGAPVTFTELFGPSQDFAYSVYFTTDADAALGSAAAVGLELTGVSEFDGPLTISLYSGNYFTSDVLVPGDLLATTTGTNLSNVSVAPNTAYSFVIQGTTESTGSNILTGSVAVSEVPLPAAAWLFASALLGLGLVKRNPA